MNILYVSNVRIPSEKAAALAIVRQCNALVKVGHTVTVFTPLRSRVMYPSLESAYGTPATFEMIYFQSFPLYFLGKFGFGLMLLYEAIRAFTFFLRQKNIAYVYSRDQNILLPFILFGFGKRCIVEIHTQRSGLLTRYVTERVRRIVVISNGLKEYYERFTKRTDIVCAPSGVDIDQFKGTPPKAVLRDDIGIARDALVLSYVGKYSTMGEEKGVDEIIKAFALSHKKNPKLHLLIVGLESAEFSLVTQRVQATGLPAGAVTLKELDQSKFAEYVNASDVLLMNYPGKEHYATYMSPTKLFAYLAAGLPIISSDLPTIREVAGDKAIVLVRPDDYVDFSKAIDMVTADYQRYYMQAKQNTEIAKKYTWDERAKAILQNI